MGPDGVHGFPWRTLRDQLLRGTSHGMSYGTRHGNHPNAQLPMG